MSETPADNPENNVDSVEEQQMHVASRREKMRKIEELGLDPWGSRFDDRLLISEIRARVGEVQRITRNLGRILVAPVPGQPVDRAAVVDAHDGFLQDRVRRRGGAVLQRLVELGECAV